MTEHVVVPETMAVTLNDESDKVRLLKPVGVGQRIRVKQTLLEANEKKPGQWLMKMNVTVEIEGEQTPALVAEILFMHIVGS